ncbi:MAG: hypothetical protein ACOVQ0_11635 [Novosphingobium sp.]|uniref:hypothetical protein n=1 Tax=Novosphingobium sp. TaxID=1874826 RepID=UPI003B995C78
MRELLALHIQLLEKSVACGESLQELRANTSIIGEYSATLLLGGERAAAINQRGWDVLGADGLRYAVKTYTSQTRTMKFKASTLGLADKALIYRLSVIDGKIQLTQMGMPTVEGSRQSPMRRDSGSNYYFYPLPKIDFRYLPDDPGSASCLAL